MKTKITHPAARKSENNDLDQGLIHEFRIVKDGIYFSLRLVEYHQDGSLDSVEKESIPMQAMSIKSLKQHHEELSQAFSKPVIEWESVPLHSRGQWFNVKGKMISFEDLKLEDLPPENQ
ncbi:MAG: hypothetical protein ABI042_18260 [Verrucomicrobiota bacterium]